MGRVGPKGDTGDQGPEGDDLTGLVYVGEVTVRQLTEAERRTVAFASCPNGKTVLSGGVAWSRQGGGTFDTVAITRSDYQGDGTGSRPTWRVEVTDFSDETVFVHDVVIMVLAICVDTPAYLITPRAKDLASARPDEASQSRPMHTTPNPLKSSPARTRKHAQPLRLNGITPIGVR